MQSNITDWTRTSEDTDLKTRWEAAQARLTQLGRSKDAAARRLIDDELQSIRRGWEQVLLLRSMGRLTDTTRFDLLADKAKALAVTHRLPIAIALAESKSDGMNPDDLEESSFWYLELRYAGGMEQFDKGKWRLFVPIVDAEVRAFTFVLAKELGPTQTLWWKDFEELEVLANIEKRLKRSPNSVSDRDRRFCESREGARWLIHNWIWDGPPPEKRRRR